MTIEFRDPPAAKAGTTSRPWVEALSPLLDHEGRWAVVRTLKSAAAASTALHRLRYRIVHMPAGKWEFRSSGPEVFARYIGPE